MGAARVSKKGWVVIPRELRQRYGIRPGDTVQIVDYDGLLTIVPACEDPLQDLLSLLEGGPSLTQALLEDRAQERARQERKIGRGAQRSGDG